MCSRDGECGLEREGICFVIYLSSGIALRAAFQTIYSDGLVLLAFLLDSAVYPLEFLISLSKSKRWKRNFAI